MGDFDFPPIDALIRSAHPFPIGRRILLVDDDRLQFRITAAHFQNFSTQDYELEWAATYEDGLAKLLTGRYAACLLDYQLGERDGLQLIREVIANGCGTPIVFLTAETAERVDIAAMNAGALDYLVKGEITSRLLERALRYALKLGDTFEALRRLATHDPLTNLLNRREFDRILKEEEERALRFGHGLALVLIDIDHFKSINDTHGHPVGDCVLVEVARRLGPFVRTVDRIVRYGGEEFAVILMQSDRTAAIEVAGRICQAIAAEPVKIGRDQTLNLTVSAGSAVLPEDARTGVELVVVADRALYAAKASGRNRAVAAGEER